MHARSTVRDLRDDLGRKSPSLQGVRELQQTEVEIAEAGGHQLPEVVWGSF